MAALSVDRTALGVVTVMTVSFQSNGFRAAASAGGSGPGLDDEVRGGRDGDADVGEAGFGQQGDQPGRTGLRAERGGTPLPEGARRADQRRGAVEDAAEGVEVVLQPVAGRGLDEHEGAAGL